MKIVIIGGGPAGLSTALKLHRAGYEISVLEASGYTRPRAGEHLAAKGHLLLRDLGIPESIWLDQSIPCRVVQGAWGKSELGEEASIYNPYGEGYILSRPGFDWAVFEYCRSIGIDVRKNFHARILVRTSLGWKISDGKQDIQADFVVDASGRNSKFYQTFKSDRTAEDELIGISMILEPAVPAAPNGTSLLVESLSNGWWYSVQLPSGKLVATLMTDASTLSSSGEKQAAFWASNLAQSTHTRQRTIGFQHDGKPFTQSAKTQSIERVAGPDWIAVGDAAISYDPLSSAGILKGLEMGQLAGTRLDEFSRGHATALAEYEGEVKAMYADYLLEKDRVYAREQRFMNHPFWYRRLLKPTSIQQFSILPQQHLAVSKERHERRLEYLAIHLPTIDFNSLTEAFGKYGVTHLAMGDYLRRKGEQEIGIHHFQALESLKMIGILEPVAQGN
ncbi:MAG: tryptophan 7-halogenase [Bacteroidota bacterium]